MMTNNAHGENIAQSSARQHIATGGTINFNGRKYLYLWFPPVPHCMNHHFSYY